MKQERFYMCKRKHFQNSKVEMSIIVNPSKDCDILYHITQKYAMIGDISTYNTKMIVQILFPSCFVLEQSSWACKY